MEPWLVVTSGPGAGQRLEIEGELTIGRGIESLGEFGADDELSRSHARLSRTPDGQIVVEDLGSTNGTFVNDSRITGSVTLRAGDRVAMGRSELEVMDPADTAIRTAPLPPEAVAPQQTVGRPKPAPPPAATQPGDPQPGARPAFAPPAPTRKGPGRDRRVPILGALLALAIAALVITFVTSDDDSTAATFDGTVYTLSNRLAPRGNSVLAFRYRRGSLYPLQMREYATGGTGGDAHNMNLALDGDQQVWTNEDHTLLFAVNMGSDSIAVFRIAGDGTLKAVSGSPFASGGVGPISVAISDGTAVVVNKGFDGVRSASKRPVITQFKIAGDGHLTSIGKPIRLKARSNPTQAQVASDGHLIFVSELVGKQFDSLVRQDDDSYVRGPVTPITDRDRRSGQPPRGVPSSILAMGIEGLVVHPRKSVIYSEVPTFSEVMAHSFKQSGKLAFESGQFVPDGLSVCWAEVSSDGRFLYITATATDRVVVFDLKDPRKPRRIQNLKLKAGPSGPSNLRLDATGRTLMVLSSGPSDEAPGTHRQIHVLAVGSDGKLKESQEPLELPVPVPKAGPMGLVALARR